MKLRKTLLLLILSVTSFTVFAQQSADAIINDYYTAIGGREKIAQINSVHMEGTFEVMGTSGKADFTILNGKGFKSISTFNDQDIIQVITDKGGWMVNPLMGSPDATALPQDEYTSVKDEIFIGGSLLNYAPNGYTVKFIGMENIDAKSAYKIEAMSKDSVKTTYYMDSATHYLSQLVREFNGQITTAKYSNFKPTDFGNIMAYSEEVTLPQGFQVSSTITKVEVNKPVDASIFDMPKQQ